MKFRTELATTPFEVKISYENRILALGSCFAGHIAARLAGAKFAVTANPTGILFNPFSIAQTIEHYAQQTPIQLDELHQGPEGWFHYDFHSDQTAPTAAKAVAAMNAARSLGAEALRSADRVLITFGTAWIFERNGEVVANCHKQPAGEFTRRRLAVEQIVAAYDRLLAGPLSGKEVILSISPVRHLGDGLEGNAVSKSILRLAAEQLREQHPNLHYFPAYEILLDDLRDYRFFADDLVHPAPQAIAYVWERFAELLLAPEARALQPAIEAIVLAAAHRPRNPHSEAYKTCCTTQLRRIAELPGVDFRTETAFFRQCIEINS